MFTQTADAAPPTLSMLRVEPAPVEARPEPRPAPSGDTLISTDKIATLSAAPRIEDSIMPLPAVAEPAPETTAEIKPEPPKVEAKAEPKIDVQDSPIAPAPELPVQAIAPAASPAETMAVAPTPGLLNRSWSAGATRLQKSRRLRLCPNRRSKAPRRSPSPRRPAAPPPRRRSPSRR